ncbi:MAG: S-methyl-5-thioribose-1-phosphate isomerase [Marinilabiliales bacterium]|nr:MAG: S-methyl-5-thioribose-1-phosphate isomerase [Marinilabiliales bacterium]
MKVQGKDFRTIWRKPNSKSVFLIDQRHLPFEFVIEEIKNVDEMCTAIAEMHVRGAGLIGASAAYGMALAAEQGIKEADFEVHLRKAGEKLKATRPTAVNLAFGVESMLETIRPGDGNEENAKRITEAAERFANADADMCRQIGLYGSKIIEDIHTLNPGRPVNVLTHCNAGWLAFVDYGSALAPVYEAHRRGIPVHVWVDETRPRNQGSKLTAWELAMEGVPHTVIVDNTGGHLMQHGMVDICIVGSDRTTRTGDVANKIGTYLKALAAHDNNVPFYAAMPSSTIDWNLRDGIKEIPIEERNQDEVLCFDGMSEHGRTQVKISPEESKAANFGFDVTPARLVSGMITERGVTKANEESILEKFPERR